MKKTLGLLSMLVAVSGLCLASCAEPQTGPNSFYPEHPFMQTNPGSMDINGRESALPNSPGYH